MGELKAKRNYKANIAVDCDAVLLYMIVDNLMEISVQ